MTILGTRSDLLTDCDSMISWMRHRPRTEWDDNEITDLVRRIRTGPERATEDEELEIVAEALYRAYCRGVSKMASCFKPYPRAELPADERAEFLAEARALCIELRQEES